ncbi:MAG: hypothetical protein QXZ43_01850 [Candidatus Aenigmatarchaeota archaeon]
MSNTIGIKTDMGKLVLSLLYEDWYSIREVSTIIRTCFHASKIRKGKIESMNNKAFSSIFDKNVWRYFLLLKQKGYLKKEQIKKKFDRTRNGKTHDLPLSNFRYRANAKPFVLYLEERLNNSAIFFLKDKKKQNKIYGDNIKNKRTILIEELPNKIRNDEKIFDEIFSTKFMSKIVSQNIADGLDHIFSICADIIYFHSTLMKICDIDNFKKKVLDKLISRHYYKYITHDSTIEKIKKDFPDSKMEKTVADLESDFTKFLYLCSKLDDLYFDYIIKNSWLHITLKKYYENGINVEEYLDILYFFLISPDDIVQIKKIEI